MNVDTLELKQMVALMGRDNQRAFDTFYHLYYSQVARTAYYYVKDVEACREIISNVFFSVWKSRKALVEVDSLDSYLYVMTKNEALRFLSKERLALWQHIPLAELPVSLEICEGDAPDEGIIAVELEQALSEAVDELPEKCRLIYLMSREEGMDNKTISERLSLSESTVRVQLKIAIEKIITSLKKTYPHLTLSCCVLYLF